MLKRFSYQFLSLILLGIGANSVGMARINNFFSATTKQPQLTSSVFKHRKNEQLSNPYKIAAQWNNDSFKQYISLKKELKQCNRQIQDNKKLIAGWHTIALGIAPAAFCGMALDVAPGLMLGIAAGPGLVGVCSSAVTIPSSLRNLWQQHTNRSRIETEIRQIVADQKREAMLREDIQ